MARATPTTPPERPDQLSTSLRRNIRALEQRRQREASKASLEERVAQAITNFTGSMVFVYLHLALYGGWILVNLGLVPGVPRFDPSFVTLAMAASVEAIFLSTFVLISQNRMAAAADKRAELDLQIGLLSEHELTKLTRIVAAIAEHMHIEVGKDFDLEEIKRDVAPEAVLDEIESTQKTG
ncbi:DUF1003 domain-containing protein [Roseomonas sp. E05]|uniref:DUF1003 domain-containing protein n=1 Tax=Roseomonas sp. E05 TaxID=3046310 RepID=UPI0024BA58D6|nr:DUF1003 domain-containing protein [Roseomonas sp. E05]MDJ0388507.1 DUF1003 domain-containing protein [Roseomonas sp. E05]